MTWRSIEKDPPKELQSLWFDGAMSFHRHFFRDYDWHRIELPKGWE